MASSTQSFLTKWQRAIARSDLGSTTRHVLLTLSLFMNVAGGKAYPSIERLAHDTGLSSRAVGEHLRKAKAAGWVICHCKTRFKTKVYQAQLPDEPGTHNVISEERRSLRRRNQVPTTFPNDHSNESLNAGIEERFREVWDSFPRNPRSTRDAALREFRKLSDADHVKCAVVATEFSIDFDNTHRTSGRRTEALNFVPSLANWIASKRWEGARD